MGIREILFVMMMMTSTVWAKPKLFVAQNANLLEMEISETETHTFFKEIQLPSDIKSIDAMVYNPVSKSIIFFDKFSKKIFDYSHNTDVLQILVDEEISNIVSLDIDFLSQNLFWLDNAAEKVEIFSLNSRARRVIYKNLKHGSQVVADFGNLFVSKFGRNGQEIRLLNMHDMSSDKLLMQFDKELTNPVQMIHDKISGMLLLIYSSNGTSITIKSIPTDKPKYFGCSTVLDGDPMDAVTKVGERVIWVDRTNVMKVFTPGNFSLETITINYDGIGNQNQTKKLIAIYQGGDFLNKNKFEHHGCYFNQTFCPHFCIPNNIDMGGACWCEEGMEHESSLDSGQLKCIKTNFRYNDEFDTILDASDYGEKIDSDENIDNLTYTKIPQLWRILVYAVISLVIILICGVIGYFVGYWVKTRPVPVVIKPGTGGKV